GQRAALLPGADPGGGRAVPLLQRQPRRRGQALPLQPRLHGTVRRVVPGDGPRVFLAADGALLRGAVDLGDAGPLVAPRPGADAADHPGAGPGELAGPRRLLTR